MYFEKLTELDKRRIENYIEYNVGNLTSPLEEILAPWDEAKSQYLSKIFGDKLIIKEHISFEEGYSDISEKLYEMLWADERCKKFHNEISDIYYKEWYEKFTYKDLERDYYYFVSDLLFNEYTFYTNAVSIRKYAKDGKKYFDLPIKDKIYRIQENMKPMRIISKIAQEYGIGMTPDENGVSDFEYFRRAHSRCLNTKTLSGELCLSIHPLDYMTMSDNHCGWDSCMSWTGDGEYKQGTVEMMNSPCVVVGYLASNYPYCWKHWSNTENRKEECWNSKKWRCLFIVDEDFIINVKGYPYENDNLIKAAIAKLTELAGWGNTKSVKYEYFDWSAHRQDKTPCIINGRDIAIDFATQAMYNDFGSCNHFIALNPKDKEPIINYNYLYSGVSECVRCGNTDPDEIGESQGEGALYCDSCDPKFYCECCDDYYTGDNYHTTAEGSKICDYCWDNCTTESDLDGKTYLNGNIAEIVLANQENEKFDAFMCEAINVYTDNIGSRI